MTMTDTAPADPRYPVGKLRVEGPVTADQREAWIDEIAQLPARLRAAVMGLSDGQLDTPYRDGGWTVRQLVHHVADSHMNAYIRFKFALTETHPPIRGYDEGAWAQLPDSRELPAEVSLALLDALHARWTAVLHAVPEEGWARTISHSERGEMRVDFLLAMYAWHSRHHTAHVTALRERMGW